MRIFLLLRAKKIAIEENDFGGTLNGGSFRGEKDPASCSPWKDVSS